MSNVKSQKSNVKSCSCFCFSLRRQRARSASRAKHVPRWFRQRKRFSDSCPELFEKSFYRCSIRWKYQTKSLRTTRRFSSCSTRFLHDFTFFSKLIKTLVPGWRWNGVNQGTGSGHEITWWIKQFIITRITPWTESNMIKLSLDHFVNWIKRFITHWTKSNNHSDHSVNWQKKEYFSVDFTSVY